MFIRFWETDWAFIGLPKPMMKVSVVKGATKKNSWFIPVVGGNELRDHNFQFTGSKLVIGADNSNVSDSCLLFVGNESSARSYVGVSKYNKITPIKTVQASNAAGNRIEVAVILEAGKSLILSQTGRYPRWQAYTWNGVKIESKIYSDKEEFYFIFGIENEK